MRSNIQGVQYYLKLCNLSYRTIGNLHEHTGILHHVGVSRYRYRYQYRYCNTVVPHFAMDLVALVLQWRGYLRQLLQNRNKYILLDMIGLNFIFTSYYVSTRHYFPEKFILKCTSTSYLCFLCRFSSHHPQHDTKPTSVRRKVLQYRY